MPVPKQLVESHIEMIRKAKLTDIEITFTRLEGDDRSYRHAEYLYQSKDLTR